MDLLCAATEASSTLDSNIKDGRAMSTTPNKLNTTSGVSILLSLSRGAFTMECDSQLANACSFEKFSFRNKAPATAVKIGARNCRTVASDTDRY